MKNIFSANKTDGKPRFKEMALDHVGWGTDQDESWFQRSRSHKLPEGVSSKMLYQDIVRIAWPSFIEFTLVQLASMVDLMMVGNLGPWALTSVGLSTQPRFLMSTLFMSLNVGATALVARYKGADQPEKANLIVRQALLLNLIFALVCSVVGFFFSKELILFMGATDDESLAGGTAYLQVQMLSLVFMAITSTITAVLRGVGNSRTAMFYNVVANVVNVIFNYLLIEGNLGFPRLEVFGASLATAFGQIVACIMAIFVIMNGKQYLHLRLSDGFKPNMEAIKSMVQIGLPAMVEQLLMRAGIIIYTKTVASLGTVAYATHQVCMNIQAMSFMTGQSFAVSATSLAGQSLGKKRPDMAVLYTSRTRRIGLVIAILIALLFLFCGGPIVALYNDDPQIISQGASVLMLMALIQPLQSSQFILSGTLRGAGDTRVTAVITFITVLLVRPLLAIVLINVFQTGLMGAWIAMVADQLVRSALVMLRYESGKWKSMSLKMSKRESQGQNTQEAPGKETAS